MKRSVLSRLSGAMLALGALGLVLAAGPARAEDSARRIGHYTPKGFHGHDSRVGHRGAHVHDAHVSSNAPHRRGVRVTLNRPYSHGSHVYSPLVVIGHRDHDRHAKHYKHPKHYKRHTKGHGHHYGKRHYKRHTKGHGHYYGERHYYGHGYDYRGRGHGRDGHRSTLHGPFLCRSCHAYFNGRDAFYDHIHHHHHVARARIPLVVILTSFGWVFHG